MATTGSVGTATVVIKSTNYADITLTVNVNATNKLVPTVTAPTANALTYNGAEQALVAAGKTTGGTMLYRLGDSEWSEQLPTAKMPENTPFGTRFREMQSTQMWQNRT